MSSSPAVYRPSRRERRPTEKVTAEAETLQQKQTQRKTAQAKADANKHKKARQQQQAVERAQFDNQENQAPSSAPNSNVNGRDPAFSSRVVAAPVEKHVVPTLSTRSSVVPPAPSARVPFTPQSTRRLTSDKAQALINEKARRTQLLDDAPARREAPILNDRVSSQPRSRQLSMTDEFDDEDNNNNFNDEELPPLWDDGDSELFIPDMDDDKEVEIECNRSGSTSDNRVDAEDSDAVATGSKRPRSPNEVAAAEQPLKKAVKLYASINKPKAGDYDSTARSLLKLAISLFRGKLATEAPWVDGMLAMTWAKGNWMDACRMYESWTAYNTELVKLITDRASHFRGEVKTKVYPMVAPQFGFKAPKSSTDHRAIDHNIKLVRELKTDFGLVYRKRSPDGNKGLYRAKIIQDAVNNIWFHNKKDEGVKYPEFYRPIPEVGLALILTAIECCIDEWASGSRTDIQFTTEEYQSVFNEHLNNLDKFAEHTQAQGILPKILMDLHDNGRVHAKADPINDNIGRAMSPSAFDAAVEEFNNEAEDTDSDAEESW